MKVTTTPIIRTAEELFANITPGMTTAQVLTLLKTNVHLGHVDRKLMALHTQDQTMIRCKAWIKKIAYLEDPVLITGPTGTGKELLASACVSPSFTEQQKPVFVAINCGAINPNLIESQFFGSVKGSYTGSVATSEGLLQKADGGVIFLDEIGDLPLTSQATLLRAIQEGEIYPVGATQPVKINCRFVAATKYDLEERVDQKLFRDDLYARISVFRIKTTPLQERPLDIPYIAEKWLKFTEPIPDHALPFIFKYNIRGLQAVVANLRAFGEFIP